MPFTSASATRIGNNQIQVDWVYPDSDPTIDRVVVSFNYGVKEELISNGTTILQSTDWSNDWVVLSVYRSLGYVEQSSWELVEDNDGIAVPKLIPPLAAPTNIVTGQNNDHPSLYFTLPAWVTTVPENFYWAINYQVTDAMGELHPLHEYSNGIVTFESNPGKVYSPLIELPEDPISDSYTLRLRFGVGEGEEPLWSDWTDQPTPIQSDPLTDPNPQNPEPPGEILGLSVAIDTTTPRVERIDLTIDRTAGSDSTLAEIKIDGSEWMPLFERLYPDTTRLRGADSPQQDQSGLIDRATQYRYSDGDVHTVSIRARMQNDSAYVYADDFTAHLGNCNYGETGDLWRPSIYHAFFTPSAQGATPWATTPHIQPVPQVQWPPNASYGVFWVKVDARAPIELMQWPVEKFGLFWPKPWLYALPPEVKDGQPHQVRFRFAAFDANGELLSDSGYEPIRDYTQEPPYVYDTLIIPISTAPAPPALTSLLITDHPTDPDKLRVTLPIANIGQVQDALIMGRLIIDQARFKVLLDGYELPTTELHSNPDGLFFDIPNGLTGKTIQISVALSDADVGISSELARLVKPFPYEKPKITLPRPTALQVQLIRQAEGPFSDRVKLTWPGGQLIEIVALERDLTGRIAVLGYADSTTQELIVEDTRKKLPRTGQLLAVVFGIRAYHLMEGRSEILFGPSLMIRALPPNPEKPANDPQVSYSQLVNELATASGKDTVMVDQILHVALTKIKDVVAKGGSVELAYFGKFSANWVNNERRSRFTPHKAFSLGVQQGTVLP